MYHLSPVVLLEFFNRTFLQLKIVAKKINKLGRNDGNFFIQSPTPHGGLARGGP